MSNIQVVPSRSSGEEAKIGTEKSQENVPEYVDSKAFASGEDESFTPNVRSYGVRKAQLMTAQYSNKWLKVIFYISTFFSLLSLRVGWYLEIHLASLCHQFLLHTFSLHHGQCDPSGDFRCVSAHLREIVR
ncbi:hypothetical protein OXX79_014170 [Metschnikowia pulcherrima]